jgi:hypothetical protein
MITVEKKFQGAFQLYLNVRYNGLNLLCDKETPLYY